MSKSRSSFLIAFLVPGEPHLALCDQLPKGTFNADGKTYDETEMGHWTGFYDWLRPAKGRVIGIRYWPFEEARFLIDASRWLGYVDIDESQSSITLRLDEGVFDERLSDSQDFGDNKIWEGGDGSYAVSFSTYSLSHEELECLKSLPVRWLCLELGISGE